LFDKGDEFKVLPWFSKDLIMSIEKKIKVMNTFYLQKLKEVIG